MTQALYWFTTDCRLSDNPLLLQACQSESRLMLVYCIDPAWFEPGQFQSTRMGAARLRFLVETLKALDHKLATFGQRLCVYYQNPEDLLAQLTTQYTITRVYCSEPIGVYEQAQWMRFSQSNTGVRVISRLTHTLYQADQLPFCLSELPKSFTKFRHQVEKSIQVKAPLDAPDNMPAPYGPVTPDWQSILPEHNKVSPWLFEGGERAGQMHLQQYFASTHPQTYKQTRNDLDHWHHSTKFSPWLAMGCVSPVQVMEYLKQHEVKFGENDSTYWIAFELLWREYFQWYALHHQSKLFAFSGIKSQKPLASFYNVRFKVWCEGSTPYPLVNACMKQLNATGFMSNRGRQIVASCLVNELGLDWRYGAAYFEQQLVDYDVASNWGNWQYLAGVGPDPRGKRHFDIAKQTKQYDPKQHFIQAWNGNDNLVALNQVDQADWPLA